MAFLERVLEPPSYGFVRDGKFYKPSNGEIFREFFSRLNIFKTRKNWLPFFGWASSASLAIPLVIFLTHYFSWKLAFAGFIYSMVCLGTHGTIYLHRYSTHRAYQFAGPVWRFIVRNLVIKVIAEEIYVISHHVHHAYSEKPGDPYNAHGGFLYCFLADVNHQLIARNLSEHDYSRLSQLMAHTGVRCNTYAQYQKWGSLCSPVRTVAAFALNWAFWYGIFFLLGGHALAIALFGATGFWAFGVRTFNYEGHGRGVDKRQRGIDFNREDFSINQIWPGYVSGEWHNNHHLFANGARAGFLPYQLDLAWLFIRFYYAVGGITSYRDYKEEFLRDYYEPYLKEEMARDEQSVVGLPAPVTA